MAIRIQVRRDTVTNWENLNPTLAQGEIGYDITTNQIKIGNGTDAWLDLLYVIGASGYSGESGYSGIQGYSGATGNSGYSGTSGATGESGFSGFSSWSGVSGYSGEKGNTGDSGFSGVQGFSGVSGATGISGFSGTSGATGISGFSGFSGAPQQFTEASSDGESTTSLLTPQLKATLNFTPTVSGTYLFEWCAEVTNSNNARAVAIGVYRDATLVNGIATLTPTTALQYIPVAGFKVESLTASTAYAYTIQYYAIANTAYIRNARMTIRRIS